MNPTEKYIGEFRLLEKIIYDEVYTISRKCVNVVFLGSCRMIVLYMYLKRIVESYDYLAHSQFGFSLVTVYHPILNRSIENPPSEQLKTTFETADLVICETIKHSKYLNTDNNTDENIYNSFMLKPSCKIVQLPNIHVNMFMDTLIKSYPTKSIADLVETRKQNIDELLNYIRKFDYTETADFIEANIYKQRLFATGAHPMPVIFQVLTKELVKKLWNIDIDNKYISDINISQFLGKEDFISTDYETGIEQTAVNY
jgi:hypothetical protein